MAKKKQKSTKAAGKKPIQRVRLSQCMIVKNEEENIEKALSWGKGIVWEQIVVDTGSADKTVELAQAMGAKVFHYTWNDDFSAAKNYAIRQAKGNWIAFLDADEWFSEEDAKKILPILEQLHPYRRVDVLRTRLVHLRADGGILGASCQDRIFRNDPKLRYHYRIHEELYDQEGRGWQLADAQNELMILHSGYMKTKNKGERNAALLEEDVKEAPRDGMRWMYLGDAYCAAGKTSEAMECYRKVLGDPNMEINHEVAPLHCGLQLMELMANDPPQEIQEEYIRIQDKLYELGWEEHPDIDYYLGCWHLRADKIGEAAILFERALKKMETYHGQDNARIAGDLEFPNRVIATAALLEGNPQKAVQFAVAALRVNRYSQDGIQLLLRAFLTEWKEGMPAEPYWQFLCKLYDVQKIKDLLFLHKFSGEAGFIKLQECVWAAMPEQMRQQLQNED